MPPVLPPYVKPTFARISLVEYATPDGRLCPDTPTEERLIVDLWCDWRKVENDSTPHVALLDFERISRIDMNVATDCLAAFASMIIGPDRPYYVVCVNVDKTLRLTLDKAFDAAAIVVAIHGSPNSGAGYVMIGDDQKKHRFKAAWEALLSCVQGKPDSNIWVAGRKFEEKRNLKPANVLQHMYLNGVLMRDPDRKPNYRLLYPLASSDTVEP